MRPPRAGIGDLLSLAWPVVLQRSAQAVVGLCDALMVAPLGEDALAAVTAGAMNVGCLFILPVGVVVLVQTFAAQLSAKGDFAGARRYGWYGLGVAFLAGIFAIAAIPGIGPTVAVLDYEPEVQAALASYAAIRLAGTGAAVGMEAIGSWYGGLGDTRVGMAASFLVMAVNVVLNFLLIEGRLGFPAMGVEGAALASTLASGAGFVAVLALFVGRYRMSQVATGPLRLSELLRLLRFGLPTGVNWFMEFSAFVLFVNVTVAKLGTATTAALLAVMQLNTVAFMPAFGLASAAAILAGQAIGAGDKDAVPGLFKMAVGLCAAWQTGVGLVYLLAARPIMGLFVSDTAGPEFLEVGAVLLALSAAWQLFDAFGVTAGEVLRAAGDTLVPMVARLLLAWLLFVPGAHLAVEVYEGGGVAAMLAIIVYLSVLAGLLVLRFWQGAWRHIELTEEVVV